jgi:hypothetical protein
MSVAVLDRQRHLGDFLERGDVRPEVDTSGSTHPRPTEAHAGLTLDELITGVWEGLAVRESVDCPACGGTMVSRPAARADVCRGVCTDCGVGIH